MLKKHIALIIAMLVAVSLMGCGLGGILPGKSVPSLEKYSTVVLMPFEIVKPTGEYDNLPTILSYGIGTKLSIKYPDKTWYFDQSEDITPVSDKMKELNISSKDVFQDPKKAAKIAEAFQADLVIVGELEKPKFTIEESGKIEEDKSATGPTGAARYYSVHQSALLATQVKVIDPKSPGTPLWKGKILGFKRYKTRYRTGNPKKQQREEKMLADVRKLLVANFVNKLYPSQAK